MLGGMRDIGQLREDLKQRVAEITRSMDSLKPVIQDNTRVNQELVNVVKEFNSAATNLVGELKKLQK